MAFANVDAVGTIFSSRKKRRGNTRVRAAKTLTPDDKPKTVWRLAKNEMMPAASVQRRRWNLKAIRFGDPSRADVARQSAHTAVHRPPLLTYLVMYWTDMDFSTQMGLCVFWVVGSGRCLPATHPRDLRLSAAEHMLSMTSANNSMRLPGLRIPGLRAAKDGICSNARDPDGQTTTLHRSVHSGAKRTQCTSSPSLLGTGAFLRGKCMRCTLLTMYLRTCAHIHRLEPDYHITNC
jgi:hypothetical protein